MARGGVYKSEVEKARNALLAQGKHPSVDALRVALGNTGSKTTIHRYLKELEAEDAQGVGGKFPLSDALADLVSRLAGQLNAEADERIADAQARCDAQLRDCTAAVEQARQESATLTAQLRRTEDMLQAEQAEHKAAQASLAAATNTIGQLEERIAGLSARLSEHEAHAQSLEQKHTHAREALEHYRASVREQRDQDQRRHEHQVQQLQIDLREARDSVTSKNQELLQLNRDNVRLTEQAGQQDRDVRELRAQVRRLDEEVQALRPLPRELDGLQIRWANEQLAGEALRADLTAVREALAHEQASRQAAETAAALATARAQAFEDMLARRAPISTDETPSTSTLGS
ncbi:plasmid replication DNA-binding protein KfrA [Tahibacter aquaticus]|uniref:Plasmid replication DNA-binding protein KfrA n=1 Tax=Tahibacter aquaticus TaxID=520092 RepID=A0A4R6YM69_9GAMM|nr:DNA-binding protein [Tahibacter aquaticus]TDR38380.1 plasmid replication DNA-binding protein KfrA [Tahibacter aquaticus]